MLKMRWNLTFQVMWCKHCCHMLLTCITNGTIFFISWRQLKQGVTWLFWSCDTVGTCVSITWHDISQKLFMSIIIQIWHSYISFLNCLSQLFDTYPLDYCDGWGGCHINCKITPSQLLGLPHPTHLLIGNYIYKHNCLGITSYITLYTKYISDMWTRLFWRQSDIVLTFYKKNRAQLMQHMYKLVVVPFLSIKVFFLHEASTYILQAMTKDVEVPFLPSKHMKFKYPMGITQHSWPK